MSKEWQLMECSLAAEIIKLEIRSPDKLFKNPPNIWKLNNIFLVFGSENSHWKWENTSTLMLKKIRLWVLWDAAKAVLRNVQLYILILEKKFKTQLTKSLPREDTTRKAK